MKVIVRDTTTNRYLVAPNVWTSDLTKAVDFGRAERAMELARETGLKDLEMMVSFGGSNFDLMVPVAPTA